MPLYQLCFSRTGAAAWLAHLDLMRMFERGFRRADLPMVWSQGFNPRPSMVFALPIGLGIEAEAEIMDFELEESLSEDEIMQRLSKAFTRDIGISSVTQIPPRPMSLMAMVKEAVYRYEGPGAGLSFQTCWDHETDFTLEIVRKGKEKQIDLQDYVLDLEIVTDSVFRIRSKAGSQSNMRPEWPLELLSQRGYSSREAALDIRIIREKLLLESET